MSTAGIVHFSLAQAPVEVDYPRPDRLLSEHNPRRETCNFYAAGGVSAGIWSCEPGRWRIAFAGHKHEYFHVLEGRLAIEDEQGLRREFGPGEAGLIPAGFRGVFQVLEPVRKHYVVIEEHRGNE